MKREILVTGGAGFIGSHLVDKLLAEKAWRVTVVDDLNDFYAPAIKRKNIAGHLAHSDYDFIQVDVRDAAMLRKIFTARRFETIVHLAARAGVRPSLAEPHLYAQTNIAGTLNLLELAREHHIKHFVFGSSSSVYGDGARVPFNEEDCARQPISPYAATKAAGELLCHTYAHLYKLRCVCLRFFTVYGARQRPDLAIHKFARKISEGVPIPVFGDGTTQRDYTFVDDIIAGVRASLDYTASDYEIFNLGESRTVQLRELIELLETALLKKAVLDFQPAQPGDVNRTFADISKARKLLNYNPQTPIETGIENFVAWFNATQQQQKNFNLASLARLAQPHYAPPAN